MLLGVDVGGTFTDAVLVLDRGEIRTAKVPTTPEDQARGVLEAVALVLERARARAEDVRRFAHGMTVTTNALLEGRIARVALIATEGFLDVIELGRQARPHLYRLCDAAPDPLVPAELRFPAPERATPDRVLDPLDPRAARALIADVAAADPDAVAVALLHSYAHPEHEQLLGELLAEQMPHTPVSLSSELVGTFREFERTATTALDAALSPLLERYLHSLADQARARGLVEPQIMQSSGGLTNIQTASRHAALTVLSGPAGGVGGALLLASLAEQPDVLCFDMGGTSCDVCLISEGDVAETAERAVSGRPLALPALDIHTVGAGGGSIAWRDSGGALRVGPQSAGADPGPACYGLRGELPTVTDANLLLGRLPEDAPLAGGLRLDRDAAARAVGALADELAIDARACAEGILRVAEHEMLGALRLITVERGIDPRGFALMPFGGAGPLHACAIAHELGIRRVLCPRASGVLCALGLAAAAPRHDVSRTVMLSGDRLSGVGLREVRDALITQADAALAGERSAVRVSYELRYLGQSFELSVEPAAPEDDTSPDPDPHALGEAFAAAHERRYGYRDAEGHVELVTVRVSAWGPVPDVELHAREDDPLAPGTAISGPAVYPLGESTLFVPQGWSGTVDSRGTVVLEADA
ncbi:MAG TPA: hydantoinase/oxoprolinase family protein [Solirubrobacteraceae bacterium]|nr:hydantoinase/oxoprolinase family protein [Solirubrobacteraceae bacterium]